VKLHVFADAGGLLAPLPIAPADLAAALEGPAAPATAFWFAPEAGLGHHGFLAEMPEAALAVLARALRDNFGRRTAPFATLPGLADAEAGAGALEALRVLGREDACDGFAVHLLRLAPGNDPDPEGPDAGWETLSRAFAEGCGGKPAELDRLTLAPDAPAFETAWLNAVAARIARRLAGRPWRGFALRPAEAAAAAGALLRNAALEGLRPAAPLEEADLAALAALTETLLERRLTAPAGGAA